MISSTSSERPTTSTPHLHRSPTDAVLFGVCGGTAEYLSVDPRRQTARRQSDCGADGACSWSGAQMRWN